MRKIILLVALVLLLAASVAGCVRPKLIEPELGENFELYQDQDAVVLGEDLRLSDLEVVNDSRCPLNVECVWAGEAVYTVTAKKADTTDVLTFTEEGLGGEGRLEFMGYTITALLQPYPNQPDDIEPDDYYLNVTVTK